ncbi:Condensin complex subunit [Coelomomyces lativittatus]|nr:Condensin complex subunit [Coelomomyces lativittatus]
MEFDFESETHFELDVNNFNLLREELNGVLPRIFDITLTTLANIEPFLQENTKSLLPHWVTYAGKIIRATEHRCTTTLPTTTSDLGTHLPNEPLGGGSSSSWSMSHGKRIPAFKARPKKVRKVYSSSAALNANVKDDDFDWEKIKLKCLETFHPLISLPLAHFFTNSEKEAIVSTIVSCVSELLQNKEKASWKNPALKQAILQIFADYAISTFEQNLRFFEFLSEPMAELIVFIENQPTPSTVTSDLLARLSQTDFSDATHSKSVSTFLITLSDLAPRIFLRHLIYLQTLLECPEIQLRSAMIHCIGQVLTLCLNADEATLVVDHATTPKLLDILIERYKDSSSQVRRRVIQVTSDVLSHPHFYAQYRSHWLSLLQSTASRLLDKTQPVRSAAIKTFTKFLTYHPFSLHGDSLNEEVIRVQADQLKSELMDLLRNADSLEETDQARLQWLEMKHHYFNDLLEFVKCLQNALPNFIQLLASKSKVEVLETMDFFVVAVQKKVPNAQSGLGSMWYLVYNVRNSDYIKDIHGHLLDCFQTLYLTNLHPEAVVKNLVTLTYHSSLADRTCLERILMMCMERNLIHQDVLQLLWSLFSTQQAVIPIQQRRGAALLLSWMTSSTQLETASHLVMLLKVLRAKDKDFSLLTHACKMLQSHLTLLPPSSELLQALLPLFIQKNVPDAWYAFAQTAIRTIYMKCTQPMVLLNDLLKHMCPFHTSLPSLRTTHEGGNLVKSPTSVHEEAFSSSQEAVKMASPPTRVSARALSRFCFVLGQVAIQQLVYLDKIESSYKKSKALTSTTKDDQSGLFHVVGSAEDVFTENMHAIRELELMYGPQSVLAYYAPMVVRLAEHASGSLKVFATTCLTQFMCVSLQFCEAHLPLLLHLVQPPYSFPLSANLMIALGDLTVCWSTLMSNANTPLYAALGTDVHLRIKKNALMVLLHLILNGMVKVKGQLGHLALCLEDPDPNIRGLTQLFFSELASKDHALANHFTDVLSYLLGFHEEEVVKKVLKTLFACLVVPREKFFESLLDKLGVRFREAGGHARLWRDLMYCVNLIPIESYTEVKVRKLLDYFPYVLDKLDEEAVLKSLLDWLHRGLKACPSSLVISECLEKVKLAKEGSNG